MARCARDFCRIYVRRVAELTPAQLVTQGGPIGDALKLELRSSFAK